MVAKATGSQRRVHRSLLIEELELRVAPAAGDLDLTFGEGGKVITPFPGGGGDVYYGTAIQSDGKIVAVGQADGVFCVTRYNADGSLDLTFGTMGLVRTIVGSGTSAAKAVAIQSDGKIVAAGESGNDFGLVRYNADGRLDTTFDSDGIVITAIGASGDYASAVVIQSDGKIVVAGRAWIAGNCDFALARYNTDGTMDTSFDGDGRVTTDFAGYDDSGFGVALQSDGKIVVAGDACNNGVTYDLAVARYNGDGSLDTTFDSDGKVVTVVAANGSHANGVAIQSDGKIVAAGYASTATGLDFAVVRYNGDGSLDTAFDSDGMVTTAFSGFAYDDRVSGMALQTDGKIVVAGYSNNGSNYDFALARYNTDGSLDTTFDGDGTLTTAIGTADDCAYAMALQTDSKIVAAGYFLAGMTDSTVVRYNSDGSLDTAFDGDGKVMTRNGSGTDEAYAMAIQSDGKIVVVGRYNGGSQFAVARYNPDGSLDATFDGDGRVTTDFGGGSADAYGVAIQSDGKIVVAGYAYTGVNNDFALARYNSDGSLDTAFDTDGMVTTDFGSAENGYGVAIQSDGKIVVVGSAWNGTNTDFALARYNSDGSLDTTFDGDGKMTTAIGSGYDDAYAVVIQSDGKIILAGSALNGANYGFVIARYNGDGSLDTTFDGDGTVMTSIGTNDRANGVVVQSDGKIVAAGRANVGGNFDIALVRYNTDGSLDTTLDGDGIVTTAIGTAADEGYAVLIQSNGNILVAGSSNNGTNLDFALVSYNADGSLDTTFGGDGIVTTGIANGNDGARAAATQSDGMIVVAGYGLFGSTNDFALVRYEGGGPAGPYKVCELNGGQVILYDTDATGAGDADVDALDVLIKEKDGAVTSVTIVGNPDGLGILVDSTGTGAVTIKDARKTKIFPTLEEISFVACMDTGKQISLNSAVTGWDIGQLLVDEGKVGDPDLDGDGTDDELTAIYCGAPIKTVKVLGQVGGDVVVVGEDAKLVGLGKLDVKNGDIVGEVVTTDGGLKSLSLKGGNLLGNVIVNGDLGKLSVKAGKDATGAPIGGTIDGVDILVAGLAKGIAADAITGSFIAAMNIGKVTVKTNLTDSRIHAGGVVDRDHNWIQEAHGNIKGVSVKGNMTDCDITAGVWLGGDGVWGTDDTVVLPDPFGLLTSIISKVSVTGSIQWTRRVGILAATDVASVQSNGLELSVKSEDLPYQDGNLLIAAGGGW